MIEFLALLRAHDIRVRLNEGNLKIDAPKGTLTPKVIETIREYKEEIVDLLKRQEQEAKAYELLKDRGWLVAEINGEKIVWTRDKKVAIPERWNNLDSYTTDELITLLKQKEG